MEHLGQALPLEGGSTGQHLEQEGARREQVDGGADLLAADLLGRHVARRAHEHAGLGELGVRARPIRTGATSGRARPKSRSLTPCSVRKTFEGLRSRWTRSRPCRASRAERMPRPTGTRLAGRERAALEAVAQGLALEPLHGDEELTLVFSHLVDLADVGVVHRRRGPGFPPEALDRGVVVAAGPDHLDGQGAVESLVEGREDDAHAPLAQLLEDPVGADAARRGIEGQRPPVEAPPRSPRRGAGPGGRGVRIRRTFQPSISSGVSGCGREEKLQDGRQALRPRRPRRGARLRPRRRPGPDLPPIPSRPGRRAGAAHPRSARRPRRCPCRSRRAVSGFSGSASTKRMI